VVNYWRADFLGFLPARAAALAARTVAHMPKGPYTYSKEYIRFSCLNPHKKSPILQRETPISLQKAPYICVQKSSVEKKLSSEKHARKKVISYVFNQVISRRYKLLNIRSLIIIPIFVPFPS